MTPGSPEPERLRYAERPLGEPMEVAHKLVPSRHAYQDVRGARLLALLDALVVRDGAAARLGGRISLGVKRDDGGWAFWRVSPSHDGAVTELFDRAPSAEVTLVLDADVAEAILEHGAPPAGAGLYALEGDRALLKRFGARYLQKRSWLDVRVGGR